MNYKKYIEDTLHRGADSSSIVGALIAGIAIGAAIGVLFAPDKGSETRHQLSDKARHLGGTIKDKADVLKSSLQSKADDLKEMKNEIVDSAKSKFNAAKDEVKNSTETA